MGKRVYEIARELDLSTREVIGRLNDAGVEVKSHFAVVEDPVYERVFGDGSDGAAPNGRSEAQEAEALRSMVQLPRRRPLGFRILVYVLAAVLAFVVAAGVGAMVALMFAGDLGLPGGEAPGSPGKQEAAPRPQHKDAAAGQKQQEEAASQREQQEAAAQQSEADYLANISEIQSNAVETFLDTHEKLLRYDALTADDLKKMQANRATLQELSARLGNLDPPQRYAAQYEVFGSAIGELEEAVGLAYEVVADPTSATKAEFDEYDRLAREGGGGLRRSNEMLGRDYKTLEGVREISPL